MYRFEANMQISEIISPVSRNLLEKELVPEKKLRNTNFGNNEIYVFSAHDSPNLMNEVGRLREIAFRKAGGGTGKNVDIDKYDTAENPYMQLIVWDKQNKEILGGYRYINCREYAEKGEDKIKLATTGLFEFSQEFKTKYLPYTIELGRSFVQPDFQAGSSTRKTLFALDNLWDGLGALLVQNPGTKYFFGKVTMYTHFDMYARDIILYFLNRFFPDKDRLVYPVEPLYITTKKEILDKIFIGKDYSENKKIMSKQVRLRNELFPPLINSYMNLSPTMRCFGTAINYNFGAVEETGIMINIEDIYNSKKRRHMKY